jgi:hypothetical protein
MYLLSYVCRLSSVIRFLEGIEILLFVGCPDRLWESAYLVSNLNLSTHFICCQAYLRITLYLLFSIRLYSQVLLHIYNITYLRSWALLEEPLIVQPLKNFPTFYGTRRLNTVFTKALHWSLSWAISIQSTPSHPISLRSMLLLPTHLRLGLTCTRK